MVSLKEFKFLKFYYMFLVDGVDRCIYIFFVKLEYVWISDDKDNIIFINLKGDNFYYVKCKSWNYGIYIVNSDSELIYIDDENNIKKLLKDKKVIMIFLVNNFKWWLLCIYWFEFIDSLLVGMSYKFLRY